MPRKTRRTLTAPRPIAAVASSALPRALAALSAVSDCWWHRSLIVLFGLRSFFPNDAVVRLPLYLCVEGVDIPALRIIISSIFNSTEIYVRGLTQTSLIQLLDATRRCVVLDLCFVGDAAAVSIGPYLTARGLPGSHVAFKREDDLVPLRIYGDSVVIAREGIVNKCGGVGVLLYLSGEADIANDLSALELALAGVKDGLSAAGQALKPENIPGDLSKQRFIDSTLTHGFQLLAGLARAADRLYPDGRFLEAVGEAWKEAAARSALALPESRRRRILCRRILDYAEVTGADYEDGYRHDMVVAHLREAEPEIFSKLDETALGVLISKLKLGRVERHGFITQGEDGSKTSYRSYTIYDRKRLEEVAKDEL